MVPDGDGAMAYQEILDRVGLGYPDRYRVIESFTKTDGAGVTVLAPVAQSRGAQCAP